MSDNNVVRIDEKRMINSDEKQELILWIKWLEENNKFNEHNKAA